MSRRLSQMIVMMTLASPQAARAIGLGEIHIDSNLNEPLSAYIDIVGASREELRDLRAVIANRETFQHFGADRPAFLNSARFQVKLDAEGRPILAIHSNEAFTDPVVSLLVDLRWPRGELVREYSLLLDPAGFGAKERVVGMAPAAEIPAPVAAPPAEIEQAVVPRRTEAAAPPPADAGSAQYRVKARDTLRMIARSTGARSETKIKRVMIATFRANPDAFDGNINRLRRNALLTLPSADVIAMVSPVEAKREVHAQMEAWLQGNAAGTANRRASHKAVAAAAQPIAVAPPPAPASMPSTSAAVAAAEPPTPAESDSAAALNRRVEALEQQLDTLNGLLRNQNDMLRDLSEKLREAQPAAEASAPAAAADTTSDAAVEAPPAHTTRWGILIASFGLLITGAGASRLWRRRKSEAPPTGPIHPYDIDEAYRTSADNRRNMQREFAPAVPTDGIIVTHETPVLDQEVTDAEVTVGPAVQQAGRPIDANGHDASTNAASTNAATTVEETLLLNTGDATARLETAELGSASDETTVLETDVASTALSTAINTAINTVRLPLVAGADTVRINGDATRFGGDTTRTLKKKPELDFTMIDLQDSSGIQQGLDDSTAQHVQMPSLLNQSPVTHERRTNFIDVLKTAIARDPGRDDLQLKLLELYFGNASSNRTSFLEVAHQLAQNPQAVPAELWKRIMAMGRQIAPEDPLFADAGSTTDGDDATAAHDRGNLADCA